MNPVNRVAYLRQRDGHQCYLCGGRMLFGAGKQVLRSRDRATVDHVTPKCKGGKDDWDNLRLAHWKCNHVKDDKPVEAVMGMFRLYGRELAA